MKNFKLLGRFTAALMAAVMIVFSAPVQAGAVNLDPAYVAKSTELKEAISVSTEAQDKAHQMAELAREFGMSEESETIQYAKSVYAMHANRIRDYNEQLTKAMDVDLHYEISPKTGLSVAAFNTMLDGTALSGQGHAFYAMEKTYNVNAVFAMGVANTESSMGAACYGNNPFGMMSRGGLIRYGSWYDAIMAFGKLMTTNLYAGKSINGMANTYCPTNSNWPNEVKQSMSNRYAKLYS